MTIAVFQTGSAPAAASGPVGPEHRAATKPGIPLAVTEIRMNGLHLVFRRIGQQAPARRHDPREIR